MAFKMKKAEKRITQIGEYSFRVRITVKGELINKVFDTLADARIFRDSHLLEKAKDGHAYEASIIEARIKKATKKYTVREALEKYLKEVTPRKKGAKVEEYRIGKALKTELMDKSFHSVSAQDMKNFMEEIGGSDNNKRKYVSIISHLYSVAKNDWHIVADNPVDKIKRPSNGDGRARRLEGNEYELLMENLTGEAKLFFILAIETSMRRGDILGLEWKHVNLKKKSAFLPDGKVGEPRTVPLSSRARECLKELKNDNPLVFSIKPRTIRTAWKNACEKIGVDFHDLHVHDIRHEAISRAFEKGLNVMQVQKLSGHKTLAMLAKYTHLEIKGIADMLD